MSLRTNYVEAAHDAAPIEALGGGLQRYAAPSAKGQRGIVLLFPGGPRPLGPVKDIAPLSMPQRRADGVSRVRPWGQANSLAPLLGNSGYIDASPWGTAIRFQNNTVNHANWGFSYFQALMPGTIDPLYYHPVSSPVAEWVVFAIVKSFAASETWTRYFFAMTGDGAIHHRWGHRQNEAKIYIDINAASVSASYPVRADGWLLVAAHHKPTSISAGTMDCYCNGAKIISGALSVFSSLSGKNVARVAGQETNKDGLCWKGLVAQAAVFVAGSQGIGVDAISRWFRDPWWFVRTERYHLQHARLALSDLRGGAEVECALGAGAELQANLQGEAVSTVADLGAAEQASGVLYGGSEMNGDLGGAAHD